MKIMEDITAYAISRNTFKCENCGALDLLFGIGDSCLSCRHKSSKKKSNIDSLDYAIHVLRLFMANYNDYKDVNTDNVLNILNLFGNGANIEQSNIKLLKSQLLNISVIGFKDLGFIGGIHKNNPKVHINSARITDENKDIVIVLGIVVGLIYYIINYKFKDDISNNLKNKSITNQSISEKVKKTGCFGLFLMIFVSLFLILFV
jgi:hypothetical protein